ncbi:hypothetical protein D3C86_858370 [compost metagenome]
MQDEHARLERVNLHLHAGVVARRDRDQPGPEVVGGLAAAGVGHRAQVRHRGECARRRQRAQIDVAGRHVGRSDRAEDPRATSRVDAAHDLLQALRQTANFSSERRAPGLDVADVAALQLHRAHRQIAVVDLEDADEGAIPQASEQFCLADALGRHGAGHVRVRHRGARLLGDGGGVDSLLGTIDLAIDQQVARARRHRHHMAVAALETPAAGDRRRALGVLGLERDGGGLHASRISISGTVGPSMRRSAYFPGLARSQSIASFANCTGT